MQIRKIIFLFIFFSVLGISFCENNVNEIESPFRNINNDNDINIINFVYPRSYNFPKINFSKTDTIRFLIPPKNSLKSNKENINGAINYNFSTFTVNKSYTLKEMIESNYLFEDSIYSLENNFKFVDIDNDNTFEVFQNLYTPWGGGESFILYWKKDENIYRFKNAFWGNFDKLIKNMNNEISFVVAIDFDDGFTAHKIREISLENCNIENEIIYSAFLSIPITTEMITEKEFSTTNDKTPLRVWPEIINKGVFDFQAQEIANGNIEAIFKKNCQGIAYGKFKDYKNNIWYLVLMNTKIEPEYNLFWNFKKKGEFFVGWLDEESLKFSD